MARTTERSCHVPMGSRAAALVSVLSALGSACEASQAQQSAPVLVRAENPIGVGPRDRVIVLDAPTGARREIYRSEGQIADQVAVSPDGRYVAFAEVVGLGGVRQLALHQGRSPPRGPRKARWTVACVPLPRAQRASIDHYAPWHLLLARRVLLLRPVGRGRSIPPLPHDRRPGRDRNTHPAIRAGQMGAGVRVDARSRSRAPLPRQTSPGTAQAGPAARATKTTGSERAAGVPGPVEPGLGCGDRPDH